MDCKILGKESLVLIIIRNKVDRESLNRVAEDLKGYIKVVVDVRRRILAAGRWYKAR